MLQSFPPQVHHPVSIFSFLTSYEVTIASDSIVINFVSLTSYVQATVFFLVPFDKFILNFDQSHVFRSVKLIGNKLSFRVLLQLVLLCYILSFGIFQFVTDKFIRVQLSGLEKSTLIRVPWTIVSGSAIGI